MGLFIDLLMDAAWKDTVQDWRGTPVNVKRGQVMKSVREMSDVYGLSVQNVRTLTNKLIKHKLIQSEIIANKAPALITLCKYENYQVSQQSANDATNNVLTKTQHTHQPTKEEYNKTNNLSKGARAREMSKALTPNYGASGVLVLEDRTVQLVNGFRAKWLETFDNDVQRLDLALAGFEIQENSRSTPEAQVSRFLGRQAGERRDRDKRYQDAKAVGSNTKTKNHADRERERMAEVDKAIQALEVRNG